MAKLGRYAAQRRKIEQVTADKTVEVSDCGTVFFVNPAAATTLTLPTPSDAGNGWWCRVHVHEGAAATAGDLSHAVNVSMTGQVVLGQVVSADGGAGDMAVANDDFFNFSAAASGGDMAEFMTDGTRWYVWGIVQDSSDGDARFHTSAE